MDHDVLEKLLFSLSLSVFVLKLIAKELCIGFQDLLPQSSTLPSRIEIA
jgi:hypothetical protein